MEYVLRNVTKRLGSVDAAVVLNDAYDDTYGIYGTTTDANHPFAPVAAHKTEDVHSTSQFVYYAKRHRDYNVFKFFGLNLIEFLSLPRLEAEQLLLECNMAKRSDNQNMADLERQLNEMGSG